MRVYNYKETNRVYSVTDSVVRIAAHKMCLGRGLGAFLVTTSLQSAVEVHVVALAVMICMYVCM